MNILAIDTAGPFLSVAVATTDNEEIFYSETESEGRQSELVMVFIDEQMKKAAIAPENLDCVLCMKGPGSFTGLRIAYSIAKGLSLSLDIPFYPIATLDCIAYPYTDGTVIPVIQARKSSYFYTVFKNGQRLLPDTDADAGAIIEAIKQNNDGLTVAGSIEQLLPLIPSGVNIVNEKRGYAKELLALAKKRDVFKTDYTSYLNTGPEY
jgi:tRNA threonylcarbamoyladenosine biosynthesis protein TsaB